MKILLLSLCVFLSPCLSTARTVRVAVLDTGYFTQSNHLKLCAGLSKDFTGTGLEDNMKHGQNTSHIITDIAKNDTDYCLIMIKVMEKNIQKINNGLKYVLEIKPDVINLSFGGPFYLEEEINLIKQILDNRIVIVAAAGNNNTNLAKDCNYYPACADPRIIVVGNLIRFGERNSSSNYGIPPVGTWAIGTNISAGGLIQTGTSQATAVITGNVVRILDDYYNKRKK